MPRATRLACIRRVYLKAPGRGVLPRSSPVFCAALPPLRLSQRPSQRTSPDNVRASSGAPSPSSTCPPGSFYRRLGPHRAGARLIVLDEAAYKHRVTRERGWYETRATHAPRRTRRRSRSRLTPITNAEYAAVLYAQPGHRAPDVDRATWESYGLIHPYGRTRRHAWVGANPPVGREAHPVVLVSRGDAKVYAAWLSEQTGHGWRLPEEHEWEKAARGTDGRYFPWGNAFIAARLNSHDQGPFDTTPVGAYADGASPFGMLDAAGQVFEWTATLSGPGRATVKGGSWDDKGCGVCRPAARHGRPVDLKHILIGFRLVRNVP